MNNSALGLLLLDLNAKNDFDRAFTEILKPSDCIPFLFNILDEESGMLPIDKILFNSSTREFSYVKYQYVENRVFSVVFDHLRFVVLAILCSINISSWIL